MCCKKKNIVLKIIDLEVQVAPSLRRHELRADQGQDMPGGRQCQGPILTRTITENRSEELT